MNDLNEIREEIKLLKEKRRLVVKELIIYEVVISEIDFNLDILNRKLMDSLKDIRK